MSPDTIPYPTITSDPTPPKISPVEIRRNKIRMRALLKRLHIQSAVDQGLAAKARLILAGKGKNGRSMSPALVNHHMANR